MKDDEACTGKEEKLEDSPFGPQELDEIDRRIDWKLSALDERFSIGATGPDPWQFGPEILSRLAAASLGQSPGSPSFALGAITAFGMPWPPLVWPLLRFLIELERFPGKIDRIIRFLEAGQPNMPILPPNPNRFPRLRRLKRLIQEARTLFHQGKFQEAKEKIRQAGALAMEAKTGEEIEEHADPAPLAPGAVSPAGRIWADILDEIKFMWEFMKDFAPKPPEEEFWPDGSLRGRLEFDREGRRKRATEFGEDGKPTGSIEWEYDPKSGDLKRKTEHDYKDGVKRKKREEEYEYDKRGERTKVTRTDYVDGKPVSRHSSDLNKKGLPTKVTEFEFGDDGKPRKTKETNYQYDENGKPTGFSVTEFDASGQPTTPD